MPAVVFLLSVCIAEQIFGQAIPNKFHQVSKRLGVVNGLANRHINSTFIDSQQRIWFLTDNQLGLYQHGKISNHTLTDNFSNKGFNSACEDAVGNIWVVENYEWYYNFNAQRIVVFNPKENKVLNLSAYLPKDLSIYSVQSTPNRKIIIGTNDGKLYSFDALTRKLFLIHTFSRQPIKILYANNENVVGTTIKTHAIDSDIFIIDLKNNKATIEKLADNFFIKSAFKKENDYYYVYFKGNEYGLKTFDGRLLKNFNTIQGAFLINIYYDEQRNHFIQNKSYSLEFYDENFRLLQTEKFDSQIHECTLDKSGNYFLSSNSGVYILNYSNKRIATLFENKNIEATDQNYSCRQILKIDDENLIVNTNRNRQLVNLRTGQIKVIDGFANKPDIKNTFVLSVLKDKNSDIIFGERGIVKTNLQTRKDETLYLLNHTNVWKIASYKNGYLLGLEKGGIGYFDKNTRKFHLFSDINVLFDNHIVYDFYFYQNQIMVAAENGLFKITDEKTIKKIDFPYKSDKQRACFSLRADTKKPHTLLVATSLGIWQYDLRTENISQFIKDKTFLDKKYLSAYRTRNGVWASSEEGVWQFDDEGNMLKIHTTADGLSSNECNRLSHFQDENDMLYFGGINGVNILNPSDFSNRKQEKFVLKIDSIYAYSTNKLARKFTSFSNSKLDLERSENSLEFVLAYEDFKYNCDKQYYYRIENSLKKDWQLLNDRRVVIDNIEHGTSTIEFRVVSCNDFQYAPIIKLLVVRPKPIYLTWQFGVLSIILVSLLVWTAVRAATYYLRRQNEILQLKVDLQTQSLKESLELKEKILSILVHDVRYPIQSFYDISKKLDYLVRKNDFERLFLLGKEAETRSRKVLWLIDELVYWVKSTQKSWVMPKEEKSVNQLIISILETYQEEIAAKKLTVRPPTNEVRAVIDYGLFVIVLRNLLFNAIIHSKPDSEISISITKNLEKSTIEIVNFYERNQAEFVAPTMGIGLTLLKPLLEKSGMKLDFEDTIQTYHSKITF